MKKKVSKTSRKGEKKMREFLKYDEDNVWHVYPVNDLEPHDLKGFDCKCGVKIEIQPNGGVVVTHNSFDKREVLEKTREEN